MIRLDECDGYELDLCQVKFKSIVKVDRVECETKEDEVDFVKRASR